MRIRLSVQRPSEHPVRILWPIDPPAHESYLISDLLIQVNKIIPLEEPRDDDTKQSLGTYVVEMGGFECLHFQPAESVFREGDEVLIRPRTQEEIQFAARISATRNGQLYIDGVRFGSPFRESSHDARPRSRTRTPGYRVVPATKRARRSSTHASTVVEESSDEETSDEERQDRRSRKSMSKKDEKKLKKKEKKEKKERKKEEKKLKKKAKKEKKDKKKGKRKDDSSSSSEDEDEDEGVPVYYQNLLEHPDSQERIVVDELVTEPMEHPSSSSSSDSSSSESESDSDTDSSSDSDSEPEVASSKRPAPDPKPTPSSAPKPPSPRRATAPGTLPGQATQATIRRQERKKYSRKLHSLQNEEILGGDVSAGDLRRILEEWKLDLSTPNSTFRQNAKRDPEVIQRVRQKQREEDLARLQQEKQTPTVGEEREPSRSAKKAFRKAKKNGKIPGDWTIEQFLAQRRRQAIEQGHDDEEEDEEEEEEGEGDHELDEDAARLRAAYEEPDYNNDTTAQYEEYDDEGADPEAWRSVIELSAVECNGEDVRLPIPDFPFNQSQLQTPKGQKARKRNKKKQQQQEQRDAEQREAEHGDYGRSQDASYYANADATLDYGDDPAPVIPATVENNQEDALDEDGFPTMPKESEITVLPALTLPVKIGTVFVFKVLTMDASWQPVIAPYHLAKVTHVRDPLTHNPTLECLVPKEDRRLAEYDEETGQRVYGKFEMPDEDEDDGWREWEFGDLIDAKVVLDGEDSQIVKEMQLEDNTQEDGDKDGQDEQEEEQEESSGPHNDEPTQDSPEQEDRDDDMEDAEPSPEIPETVPQQENVMNSSFSEQPIQRGVSNFPARVCSVGPNQTDPESIQPGQQQNHQISFTTANPSSPAGNYGSFNDDQGDATDINMDVDISYAPDEDSEVEREKTPTQESINSQAFGTHRGRRSTSPLARSPSATTPAPHPSESFSENTSSPYPEHQRTTTPRNIPTLARSETQDSAASALNRLREWGAATPTNKSDSPTLEKMFTPAPGSGMTLNLNPLPTPLTSFATQGSVSGAEKSFSRDAESQPSPIHEEDAEDDDDADDEMPDHDDAPSETEEDSAPQPQGPDDPTDDSLPQDLHSSDSPISQEQHEGPLFKPFPKSAELGSAQNPYPFNLGSDSDSFEQQFPSLDKMFFLSSQQKVVKPEPEEEEDGKWVDIEEAVVQETEKSAGNKVTTKTTTIAEDEDEDEEEDPETPDHQIQQQLHSELPQSKPSSFPAIPPLPTFSPFTVKSPSRRNTQSQQSQQSEAEIQIMQEITLNTAGRNQGAKPKFEELSDDDGAGPATMGDSYIPLDDDFGSDGEDGEASHRSPQRGSNLRSHTQDATPSPPSHRALPSSSMPAPTATTTTAAKSFAARFRAVPASSQPSTSRGSNRRQSDVPPSSAPVGEKGKGRRSLGNVKGGGGWVSSWGVGGLRRGVDKGKMEVIDISD